MVNALVWKARVVKAHRFESCRFRQRKHLYGAVRRLLSGEGRKAVGVRVPLLPPMDSRIGALLRLESGEGQQAVGVRLPCYPPTETRIGVLIALEKRDCRKAVWVRVLLFPPVTP